MSVKEKARQRLRQISDKETSESKPLQTYRNTYRRCRNWDHCLEPRTNSRGDLSDCLNGVRYGGGVTLTQALVGNVGTCCSDVKGEIQEGKTFKGESTEAEHRGGLTCSSEEVSVMEMERRGEIV